MAKSDMKDTPRIGVFVCHCGTGISEVVKVNEVVNYAKKLPGVAQVEDTLYYCSDEGRKKIKETIKKQAMKRLENTNNSGS